MRPRCHQPRGSRSGSAGAASPDSWQRAPGSVAQLFQREHALHTLTSWRELPRGIVLDIGVGANLGFGVNVALDAALDIGNKLERGTELFFLVLAVRAPPRTIHLDAAILQALRKAVIAMLATAPEVKGTGEGSRNQHTVDGNASPVRRGRHLVFLFLSFSPLF